jgi:anti-sigma factor ChrR (cupin superfamily)
VLQIWKEDPPMPIVTPDARNHTGLAPRASRYVDVGSLPWVPTRFKGVEMKTLMEDKETGLMTALVRFAPGAVLPDHEHVELEQTWVIEARWRTTRASSPPATMCGAPPAVATTPALRMAA